MRTPRTAHVRRGTPQADCVVRPVRAAPSLQPPRRRHRNSELEEQHHYVQQQQQLVQLFSEAGAGEELAQEQTFVENQIAEAAAELKEVRARSLDAV